MNLDLPTCVIRSAKGDNLILQRTVLDCPPARRALYWRHVIGPDDLSAETVGTQIRFGGTAAIRFDTYFGSFFEQHWRLHTRLDELAVSVHVRGDALVQVWRRSSLGETLVGEQVTDGRGAEIAIPHDPINHRQYGLLFLTIAARGAPVVMEGAEWIARNAAADPVGLAAVFCTFNREADIARLLTHLADNDATLAALARVVVVNQGRPGLLQYPHIAAAAHRMGDQLMMIEQDNFGGAGGFTRGLMAALDDQAATHFVFLDDDIRIEPESLCRLAAFFALASRDIAVGGHMLDLLQPQRLFEAGATIGDRNWGFLPQHHMVDLIDPMRLVDLTEPQAVHYCGWWCFGAPLRLVREVGLPLPCFIRGDDLEYGLRLHGRGIPNVPMPGIAVWHEPFYLRIGGWQLYYETRNMLVAGALHLDFAPHRVAARMAKHLLLHLLTFRYYSAALVIRGIEDFLTGPAILDGDPAVLHATLAPLRAAYPQNTTPCYTVLPRAEIPPLPRGQNGYRARFILALLRNWFVPAREVKARRMPHHLFGWVTAFSHDHLALDTGWDTAQPTVRRCRTTFRALARRGFRAIMMLYRRAPALQAVWRGAAPRLISETNWRAYLRLPPRTGSV